MTEPEKKEKHSNTFLALLLTSVAILILVVLTVVLFGPEVFFTYIEGSLGALVMVISATLAIIVLFLGKFKLSGIFFTIAVCAFILRSLVSTFFNDASISGEYTEEYAGSGGTTYNDTRVSPRWTGLLRSRSKQKTTYQNARKYNETTLNPEPVKREKYAQFSENGRILTIDESVSTFSIDVDTGSYTNMRRYISKGLLPPVDSVRIEEFINYFNYNYPTQTDHPFALHYQIAPSPLQPEYHLLKLGIKARDISLERKPWNLVFLIDISGSMGASDKLPLLKKIFKILVYNMGNRDKISIVTYAGDTQTALEPSGIEDRNNIFRSLRSLTPGGSTYGSKGIQTAYRMAEEARIPGGVNRVILATDGDFNVGMTNINALVRLIENKRKTGISLTTLGFGGGVYKESTLEQLANKGNGNYFYIDSFKEGRKVFETDLTGNMETVAKDVKLQIEFNPAQVAQYRLLGYENRKLEKQDFNNDTIDAGEIGSSHTVTALYELILTGTPAAEKLNLDSRYQKTREQVQANLKEGFKNEIAFLNVRYKTPEGKRSKLLSFPVSRKDILQSPSEAGTEFNFATAVAGFGHILNKSQFAGEYDYSDIVELAESSKGIDSNGYRREFIELVKNTRHIRD